MIRALLRIAAFAMIAAIAAGCGQKGPLRLPEPPKPASISE
jgi:predicted small lipoprotein YifL